MGKIVGVIIGIVVFAIMFPIVLTSINDAQTEVQLDPFPGCVVAGTTTDVVLTEDLFNDRTSHVIAITATGAGAVPVAGTYVPATNTLTVTGLGAVTPQDLTVSYRYSDIEDFTGLGDFMNLTPLLMWLGVIFALIGGVFFAIKSRG